MWKKTKKSMFHKWFTLMIPTAFDYLRQRLPCKKAGGLGVKKDYKVFLFLLRGAVLNTPCGSKVPDFTSLCKGVWWELLLLRKFHIHIFLWMIIKQKRGHKHQKIEIYFASKIQIQDLDCLWSVKQGPLQKFRQINPILKFYLPNPQKFWG